MHTKILTFVWWGTKKELKPIRRQRLLLLTISTPWFGKELMVMRGQKIHYEHWFQLLVWQEIEGYEKAQDSPISASCLARNLRQWEGTRFLQTNKRFTTNNNFSFLFGKEFKAMRRREILTYKWFQLLVWQGIEGALRRQWFFTNNNFNFWFGKELKVHWEGNDSSQTTISTSGLARNWRCTDSSQTTISTSGLARN